MGFWQRLLSIRTDSDAAFRSLELTVRGVGPLLWTLCVTLIAGAVIVSIYWFQQENLSTRRRLWLAGLRLLAVLILCMFVFRPISLSAVLEGERPRTVVLLLDNTQSMRRQDDRPSEADLLRVALAKNLIPPTSDVNDAGLMENLTETMPKAPARLDMVRDVFSNPQLALDRAMQQAGPVQQYTFGRQTIRLTTSGPIDLQKVLTGEADRTALADSLHALLLEGDVDRPTAVIVVTDGCDNDSRKDLHRVAEEYRKLGVPLHIYGVGSTRGDSLELIDATVPEVVFAGDTVGVPVRWKATGDMKGKVRFSILLGDELVGSKEIDFEAGSDLRETVTFLPERKTDKARLEKLHVKIEVVDQPKLSDSLTQPIKIVDSKIKVLYLENMPRWEYKFIQQALLRDRRVDAKFLLFEADEETLKSGSPYLSSFPKTRKALFEYDLIFLGDVKGADLRGERMKWLDEFVKEGGGLVQLAGQLHAPAELVGTPLEEMLPVKIRPRRFTRSLEVRTEGFQPRLTRYGRRSDLLSMDDAYQKNLQIWKELPSLFWTYPVDRLRAGAIPLLEHPGKKAGDDPMPILAQRHYGKGQVLFVGFAETWRWRFNEGEKYHNRFWGQIVYQIGLHKVTGNKGSRLALDRARIYLGQEGRLFAHLVDADLKPVTDESVKVEIRQVDGPADTRKSFSKELFPVPGDPGEYQAFLANDHGGTFVARVPGQKAQLEYRVEVPPNHELAIRGLDAERLQDAATTSGGKFYREENLHELRNRIQRRNLTYQVRPTVPLLCPLTFLLFVGILAAEWILRKYSNLS